MAKKSFKNQDNPALAYIRGTQEEHDDLKTQDTQDTHVAQEEHDDLKTQDTQDVHVAQDVRDDLKTQDTQDVHVAQDVRDDLKTQDTQDVHVAQEVQGGTKTQGRKGQKLPRINMAFSQDNLEYLQLISRIEGISITKYVNHLIESDRKKRKDIIEKAKALLMEAKK